MLPDYILVHTATPVSNTEAQSDPPEWIEGEPGPDGGGEPTPGASFPCVLFLPSPGGSQDTPYRPRVVRTPTLLYNPTRDTDDTPIIVLNENELLIDAPELAAWTGGVSPARWLTDGDPQPFGPPGELFGIMATLRMVKD